MPNHIKKDMKRKHRSNYLTSVSKYDRPVKDKAEYLYVDPAFLRQVTTRQEAGYTSVEMYEDKFFDCTESESGEDMQAEQENDNITDAAEFKRLLRMLACTSQALYPSFKQALHDAKKSIPAGQSVCKKPKICDKCSRSQNTYTEGKAGEVCNVKAKKLCPSCSEPKAKGLTPKQSKPQPCMPGPPNANSCQKMQSFQRTSCLKRTIPVILPINLQIQACDGETHFIQTQIQTEAILELDNQEVFSNPCETLVNICEYVQTGVTNKQCNSLVADGLSANPGSSVPSHWDNAGHSFKIERCEEVATSSPGQSEYHVFRLTFPPT